MNLLSDLAFLDFVATVCACVIALFLSIPAYRRTKQLGFLLWIFSSLGSLWNTITFHAFLSPASRHFIHYSYRTMFIVDSVLSITGTVLVIRGYMRLFESSRSTESLLPPSTDTTHVA